MRPGTPERIEYYRQRASANLPLFTEAPVGIPILPSERQSLPCESKPMSEQSAIDNAIDILTSPDAAANFERRIKFHEDELAKLRQLQKALFGKRASSQGNSKFGQIKLDVEKEQAIVDVVSKKPATCAAIAKATGMPMLTIGKTVKASSRLQKNGNLVELSRS